jgi:cardiolipin synthase
MSSGGTAHDRGDAVTMERWPRIRRAVTAAVLVPILAGCAHHQPVLKLPRLEVGHATFASTVAAHTGSAVVGGNRVEILLNGDEIFPAKLRAIEARKTINYAQYSSRRAARGGSARAFAERCRAGVRVNVLLDAIGALALPEEYRQIMLGGGCRVETFRPLSPFAIDRVNNRNHRRVLVVDGRVGITGGSGTSGKWSGDGKTPDYWRDTDVLVEGPVVEQLQGAFAENWLEATGIALGGTEFFPHPVDPKGQVMAQAVRSSPAGGSAAMYTMFLLAMASARQSIYITNPYFLPDDKMIDTLVGSARKGVRVVLLLPGAIDHNLVRQASRSELGRLLEAGIEVHEYRAALLHAKTMVVDSRWATVGSTNFDRRSFALNDEINLVVYDEGVARKLEKVFEQDLIRSKRVTYAAWRNRGTLSRLMELLSLPVRGQM